MSPNILVTGAAGYIGGSIVVDLLEGNTVKIEKRNLYAAVRSEEQQAALEGLGVNVLRLGLQDEKSVTEAILKHKISVVIQTASAIDPGLSTPLIHALGEYKRQSGEQTFYIHTSGLSAFYPKTGWPEEQTQDSSPLFETEKRLADSFPIRATDVAAIEKAKEEGVESFIVIPSTVYGKGLGPWNKLSVVIPVYIKACISKNGVYKFPEDTKVASVHIRDICALYALIVDSIVKQKKIPSQEEGFYFAIAHESTWWEILDHLAPALKTRGLIPDTDIKVWSNDTVAAESLGIPEQFLQVLWNSGAEITSERPYRFGWKPVWGKEHFLKNIDGEIQDVVDEGKAKSSLIDSLFAASKG